MRKPVNYYLRPAKALMQAGNPQRALTALHSGLLYHAEDARMLFWAGRAAMRCKKYDEGELFLRKALRQGPENILQVLDNLMVIYEQQKRWGEALVILERSLVKHPESTYIKDKIQTYRSRIVPDFSKSAYKSFIFTHIPKTGGMSLRQHIFDGAVRGGIEPRYLHIPGVYGRDHNENLVVVSTEQREKIRKKEPIVLADHSHYDPVEIFEMHSLISPFYYVMIREPLERVKSHYYFEHFADEKSEFYKVSLNDMNDSDLDKTLKHSSNFQTVYMTGYQWWSKGYKMDEETFKKACENLEYRYHCFGIFEYMNESMRVLKKEAPTWLKLSDTLPAKNKSVIAKNKTILSERVVQNIKKLNQWDFEFYDFALKLFEKRYAKNERMSEF